MLALSLAFLGGVDTDPRGLGAIDAQPFASIEAAPAARLEVDVLRFDVGARVASEFGVALFDFDGALNAATRVGDDDLSLTFAGAASLVRMRGAFASIDSASFPVSRIEGSWTPAALAGVRFHLDMDDFETSLAWSSDVESAHAATSYAPLVPMHAAHRVDGELRGSLATFIDDRGLRDDVKPASALLLARAAQHDFAPDGSDRRGFLSLGGGLAWHTEAADARAWSGPAFTIDAHGVGSLDVVGAAEVSFDVARRTFIARAERRPVASPLHASAMANGGSVAVATAFAFLDLAASVSGAFIQLPDDDDDDDDDGLRGDAVVEVRWPFEIVTAVARAGVEACAFGATGFARGVVVFGAAF